MTIRNLINHDGKPFDKDELSDISNKLGTISDESRFKYRENNANEIVSNELKNTLIVSGPGTGKSYIFISKIIYWSKTHPGHEILVTSFVRKLVYDLKKEIENNDNIKDEQKELINATTLHRLARSIIESNSGYSSLRFKKHIKIIGQSWKKIVWSDVLSFFNGYHNDKYSWDNFEKQLYDVNFINQSEWKKLTKQYIDLCLFYNAVGFADMILIATEALKENTKLNPYKLFIIDEYQDFNQAEENLITELTKHKTSLLIVGDDDQILYDELKCGRSELIKRLYDEEIYIKAMLPFCSRCNYHITKCADYFLQKSQTDNSIKKIFLPFKANEKDNKVEIIACAAPSSAVDYIINFINTKHEEIEIRKELLKTGREKDAFLLILSPVRNMSFLGDSCAEVMIHEISKYQEEIRKHSDDYFKILTYYSVHDNPQNNFSFRKILSYENIDSTIVHKLISKAIEDSIDLYKLKDDIIDNILKKCKNVHDIVDGNETSENKLLKLSEILSLIITQNELNLLLKEHVPQEEEAELEEIEIQQINSVESMTIVGSKGLSADHVIILGFDDVNMGYVTRNAFYVALTRARQSLTLITSLKSRGSSKAHDFLNSLPDEHIEYFKYKKDGNSKIKFKNRNDFNNYLNYIWEMQHKK